MNGVSNKAAYFTRLLSLTDNMTVIPDAGEDDCWICQIEADCKGEYHDHQHLLNHVLDQKMNRHLFEAAWRWFLEHGREQKQDQNHRSTFNFGITVDDVETVTNIHKCRQAVLQYVVFRTGI